MSVLELEDLPTPRHLDARGVPLCTAPAEGAIVVDEPVDVTCTACLLELGDRLRRADGTAS